MPASSPLNNHGRCELRRLRQEGHQDPAPVERDSIFRIYSMTKPVTGVAMMMLYERRGASAIGGALILTSKPQDPCGREPGRQKRRRAAVDDGNAS